MVFLSSFQMSRKFRLFWHFFLMLFFVSFVEAKQSVLNLSISSNPSRINPILSTDSASSEISGWLFNGLFKYDKFGKIIPDIAKNYKFENPQKLRVFLRNDVFWHDGNLLTANDVIFTFDTIRSPKIFAPITGDFEKVKSIEKISDFEIIINYKEPYYKALEIWMVGLLPKHILVNEKDLMTSKFNKKPIGNGPYKLKKFEISSDIELIANKKFYDGEPKINMIQYKFLPDSSTSFLLLGQKKLDLASLNPLQLERQITDEIKQNYKVFETTSFAYTYIGFNLKNKKFANPKIREALSLAVNRQEIIDIMFFGHAQICYGPFLPKTFAYNEKFEKYEFDLRKAKKILKSFGYDENNPFEFEVVTNANNSIKVNTAEILQYQLAKINVKMKIKVMEWQAFLNTVVTPKKFEAIILGWSLSLLPDAFPIWHSKSDFVGGFNIGGYKNNEVDRLIEEASKTVDEVRLSLKYKKIFELIRKDNPYIFLYIPNSITAVNKKIRPIEPALIGIMHNQKDWIKE